MATNISFWRMTAPTAILLTANGSRLGAGRALKLSKHEGSPYVATFHDGTKATYDVEKIEYHPGGIIDITTLCGRKYRYTGCELTNFRYLTKEEKNELGAR